MFGNVWRHFDGENSGTKGLKSWHLKNESGWPPKLRMATEQTFNWFVTKSRFLHSRGKEVRGETKK